MPITIRYTETAVVETYTEIRNRIVREERIASTVGLMLLAACSQIAAADMPYLERRASLLSARARFSLARHKTDHPELYRDTNLRTTL